MDRLAREQERLYGATAGDNGKTRALTLGLDGIDAWANLAGLIAGMQADLDLPAPALAVDGQSHCLWFSLAEPVERADGEAFLACLSKRYLGHLPASRLRYGPQPGERPPPQVLTDGERWSAFIDPELGSLFSEAPWLDTPPPRDKQADLLAALRPIEADAFAAVLAVGDAETVLSPFTGQAAKPSDGCMNIRAHPGLATHYDDPRTFLLAVMNDTTADLAHRIEAAAALLPCFERNKTS